MNNKKQKKNGGNCARMGFDRMGKDCGRKCQYTVQIIKRSNNFIELHHLFRP